MSIVCLWVDVSWLIVLLLAECVLFVVVLAGLLVAVAVAVCRVLQTRIVVGIAASGG